MSRYLENKDLIERCLGGSRSGQYELYQKYSKAMFNICYRMLNDRGRAEDVLQMSFMDVFRNLGKYRFESTLGAWIKRIVVNNCINDSKKNRLYFEEVKDSHGGITEEVCDDGTDSLTVGRVKNAIHQLPEGYRVVFSLYLLDGYDHKEIGQILNISEATSKSQFSRAKKKMRELLKEEMV